MDYRYILDGHNAVPCGSLYEWAKWFEKAERHVANDERGGIRISTVFLGIDHSFGGPTPLLFETMIFGGAHDDYQKRYTTWEEAERGHKVACDLAFGLAPPAEGE